MAIRFTIQENTKTTIILTLLKSPAKEWKSELVVYKLLPSADKIIKIGSKKYVVRPNDSYDNILKSLRKNKLFELPGFDYDHNFVRDSYHGSLFAVEIATNDYYQYYDYDKPLIYRPCPRTNYYLNQIIGLISKNFEIKKYAID